MKIQSRLFLCSLLVLLGTTALVAQTTDSLEAPIKDKISRKVKELGKEDIKEDIPIKEEEIINKGTSSDADISEEKDSREGIDEENVEEAAEVILEETPSKVGLEVKVEAIDQPIKVNYEVVPGLMVHVIGANRKALQKDWTRYLKKQAIVRKVEVDKNKQMTANRALIPGLESLPLNVYSKVVETANGAYIECAFQLDEIFLSAEQEDKWETLRTVMREYGIAYRKEIVQKELDNANKDLSNIQSRFRKLKQTNASLYSDIEMYKRKIVEAEKAIVQNEEDQVKTNLEIDESMQKVRKIRERLDSIE